MLPLEIGQALCHHGREGIVARRHPGGLVDLVWSDGLADLGLPEAFVRGAYEVIEGSVATPEDVAAALTFAAETAQTVATTPTPDRRPETPNAERGTAKKKKKTKLASLMNQPPPGGWTEADKVPAAERRVPAASPTPSAISHLRSAISRVPAATLSYLARQAGLLCVHGPTTASAFAAWCVDSRCAETDWRKAWDAFVLAERVKLAERAAEAPATATEPEPEPTPLADPVQALTQGRTIWDSDGTDGPVLICPPPTAKRNTHPLPHRESVLPEAKAAPAKPLGPLDVHDRGAIIRAALRHTEAFAIPFEFLRRRAVLGEAEDVALARAFGQCGASSPHGGYQIGHDGFMARTQTPEPVPVPWSKVADILRFEMDQLQRQFDGCCWEFRQAMERLGRVAGRDKRQVYFLWREYSARCSGYDQSAILGEFVDWYADKLGGDKAALAAAVEEPELVTEEPEVIPFPVPLTSRPSALAPAPGLGWLRRTRPATA